MDYRRLGRSGLEVSVVGVGCNQFGGPCDRKQTRAIVHAAMDVGITLFDTSNSYGENRPLGEVSGRRPQRLP